MEAAHERLWSFSLQAELSRRQLRLRSLISCNIRIGSRRLVKNMKALLFKRGELSSSSWSSRTGHAPWEPGELLKEAQLRALRWSPLGWGDEWELEMFLHSHSAAVLGLLTGQREATPAPSPVRAPLGNHVDLMIPLDPCHQVWMEVKGPGLGADDKPGVQVVEYRKKFAPMLVAAVGIGEKPGNTLGAYDPVNWWQGADSEVKGDRRTLLGMRTEDGRIALCSFNDPREAQTFLKPLCITIPEVIEKTLVLWKKELSLEPKLSDAERRSYKIELGRTTGKTDTENRWSLRIFEDHIFLICSFQPPDDVLAEMTSWNHLAKGSSANYESYRKYLGPAGSAPPSGTSLKEWLREHIPGNVKLGSLLSK